MKTLKKILITAAAINATAFIITLFTMVLFSGMHTPTPAWFNVWGTTTLIIPFFIFIIYFVTTELIELWKP